MEKGEPTKILNILWDIQMIPIRVLSFFIGFAIYILLLPIQLVAWIFSKKSFWKTNPYYKFTKYFEAISMGNMFTRFRDEEQYKEWNKFLIFFHIKMNYSLFWKIYIQGKKYKVDHWKVNIID